MRESEYVKNITKKNQGADATLILNENTYINHLNHKNIHL